MSRAPASETYEVSATYLGALVQAMCDLGALDDAVLEALAPVSRRAAENPHLQRWWDGRTCEAISRGVIAVHGPAKFAEVAYHASSTGGMQRVLAPLVSVVGTLFGLKPDVLFARMPDFTRTSVKGVAMEWTSTSPTSGELRVRFPPPLARAEVEPLWVAAIRYGYALTKVSGRWATRVDNSTLHLACSWGDP